MQGTHWCTMWIVSATLLFTWVVPTPLQAYQPWTDRSAYYPCNAPCQSISGRFIWRADYLYWQPCTNGFFIATKIERDVERPYTGNDFLLGESDINRHIETPSSDWHSGFKVGIGYQPCNQYWDLQLIWTYFEPRSHTTVRPSKNKDVIPFTGLGIYNALTLPGTTTLFSDGKKEKDARVRSLFADFVKGRWEMCWSVVDLEFGRELPLATCFSMKPFICARYAYIEQELRIRATGEIFENKLKNFGNEEKLNFEGDFASEEHFKKDFWGVGGCFGLKTNWSVGCCWGLYGEVAASLIYGEDKYEDQAVAARFNTDRDKSDSFDFCEKLQNNRWCTKALADLGLGIYWHQQAYDCYAFLLKLGWEYHYLFDRGVSASSWSNAILSPSSNHYIQSDHDLIIQGLTITIGIDF